MKTFETAITTDWLEVLLSAESIWFDVLGATEIYVRFTEEVTPDPADNGNQILTYPTDWDFKAIGMPQGQMIWLKTLDGDNRIRGLR